MTPGESPAPQPATGRSIDEIQHHAALDLSPTQQEEFQRLVKTLCNARGFRLLFAEINTAAERERVRSAIAQVRAATPDVAAPKRAHLVINLDGRDAPADFAQLEAQLSAFATPDGLIEFINGNSWLWSGEKQNRLSEFNVRRDALARKCPSLHLWWVSTDTLQQIATRAPDLWSWRSGVFDFRGDTRDAGSNASDPFPALRQQSRPLQRDATFAARAKRIGALAAMVEQTDEAETRWSLLLELADLNKSIGELDRAKAALDRALPLAESLPDDGRAKAITLGRIADVLYARGELDEALRIHREEQLPVFERLGDVRSRAVTLGKIADVLYARGEIDEALRIRREEQLPVFEKLNDVRESAVTLGQIADVLYDRGELDEALRIRREEELPVYEKLGDVRSRAITLGQIADVLYARGELDEALRIRRAEELPVYEKLGDVRSLLFGRANLAMMLMMRQAGGDLTEAKGLLDQSLVDADRMRIPEAGQIRSLLDQLAKLQAK